MKINLCNDFHFLSGISYPGKIYGWKEGLLPEVGI